LFVKAFGLMRLWINPATQSSLLHNHAFSATIVHLYARKDRAVVRADVFLHEECGER
jgi:hypothetical protein